jgi:Protein of unknown function (DUF3017)
MPLTAPPGITLAAASLIRAGLLDDGDAGVLIIRQNGADTAQLTALTIAVTFLAVRVLLAANGFDVTKALAVIDQWLTAYAAQADTLTDGPP